MITEPTWNNLLLSLITKYSSISISLSNSINVVTINVKDELGFK
jgi:hypothetical protein